MFTIFYLCKLDFQFTIHYFYFTEVKIRGPQLLLLAPKLEKGITD